MASPYGFLAKQHNGPLRTLEQGARSVIKLAEIPNGVKTGRHNCEWLFDASLPFPQTADRGGIRRVNRQVESPQSLYGHHVTRLQTSRCLRYGIIRGAPRGRPGTGRHEACPYGIP